MKGEKSRWGRVMGLAVQVTRWSETRYWFCCLLITPCLPGDNCRDSSILLYAIFVTFRAETTWIGSHLLKYAKAAIGAKCGADLGDSFSNTVSFHEKILNPLNVMIERKYTCFRTSWLMVLGLIWGERCMLALWNRLSLVGKLTRLKLFSTARLRVSAVSV